MIPFGLHYDEAGMAYDAWCLHGVDRVRYMLICGFKKIIYDDYTLSYCE